MASSSSPADAAAVALLGSPGHRWRPQRASTPTWDRSWRTSAVSFSGNKLLDDNSCGGEESRADRDRGRHPGDLRRHPPCAPFRGQHQDLQGRDRRRRQLHRHGRHGGALPGAAQGHGLHAARDPQAGQQGRSLRHLHQAAPLPEGQLLPADQGRGQRPLRVQPVQRGDRQRERHLRPLQLPRGLRVQGVLGHRFGPQLRAGRDARGLRQGKTAREVAEASSTPAASSTAIPNSCATSSPSKRKRQSKCP